MKRLSGLLAAAALALAVFAPTEQAHAAYGSYLCAPSTSDVAIGPKRIVNTSSTASPQPAYVLNGQGCAFIANTDVGFFLALGFTGGQDFFTTSLVAVTANTTTTNSPTLPAGAYIHNIIIGETAGNAVTGGVDIGTAASGAQIASAIAVAGNALVTITDAGLLKRSFGTGPAPAAQQIFFTCHTACNSASLNITIMYSLF
jgi:hypothetical protein